MLVCKISIASILLVVFLSYEVKGQVARTPFSSFGIGTSYSNGLAYNQGMGGIGIAAPNYRQLNVLNPALLIFNTMTIFEAGLIMEQRVVMGDNGPERNGNAGLNYLSIGLPIKRRKWTMGIGVQPYTNVNYKLDYRMGIEGSSNTLDIKESGSGGINQLFWSNGVALHKNVSIGVKAIYLFSSIINESSASLTETDQLIRYSTALFERQSFSGFGFSTGISFHVDSLLSNKDYQLNVGIVYDFNTKIQTQFYKRLEKRTSIGAVDSVTLMDDVSGTTSIPSSIGAGISLGKMGKWLTEVDFSYFDPFTYNGFIGNTGNTKKGWKISAGGKFTPDERASSYLKRITYQVGFNFEESSYLVNGNILNDYGLHFGISFPIGYVSHITLATRIGKKGDIGKNTIEENYFKLYFGITFNDQWFIKRRFD